MAKWLPAIILGIIALVSLFVGLWVLVYLATAALLAWLVYKVVPPRRQVLAAEIALAAMMILVISGLLQAYWMRGIALSEENGAGGLLSRLGSAPTLLGILAFVASILITIPIIFGLGYAVLWVSSEYVLHLPTSMQVSRQQAMKYLSDLLARRVKASIKVDQGRVVAETQSYLAGYVGGLGQIIVAPMNAVLLEGVPKAGPGESKGPSSRFIGSGTTPLQYFERVRQVIDLRPRQVEKSFRGVLTRDRVPLAFRVRATYQIESEDDVRARSTFVETEPVISGPYPVYVETLQHFVDNVPKDGEDDKVLAVLEVALRDTIEQRVLDALLGDPNPAPVIEFAGEVADRFLARLPQAGLALPQDRQFVQILQLALVAALDERGLTSYFGGAKTSLFAVLSAEVKQNMAARVQPWGIAIRSLEIANMTMSADVRQTVVDLWRQKQEAKIALEGIQSKARVLYEWSGGVRDAVKVETTARSELAEAILEMLRDNPVGANAEAVLPKLMDFLTRETSVPTLPEMQPPSPPPGKKPEENEEGELPPGNPPAESPRP